MTDSPNDPLAAFVDSVVAQLTKNGYPERRVAFPLVRMYESADAKGLSFNKVLQVLAERGIGHEKTPEKVIFAPVALASPAPAPSPSPSPFAGGFPGLDPAMFAGMSQEQLFAAAQAAMQQMGPEQLAAVRAMVEGMTPEQQAAMFEQARKLGLV
ncbi:MAG: hypothetical protein QM778_12080 [Myxococcales bacterium]